MILIGLVVIIAVLRVLRGAAPPADAAGAPDAGEVTS
jgi:hypothetical protein